MEEQFKSLVRDLNDQQLTDLARHVQLALEERRPKVNVEDITVARMRDPEFAARVRAEVDLALKGFRGA
jgi:hypothetical protein